MTPSQDADAERKVSRRRFVKSAGTLAAIGLAGLGLESLAGRRVARGTFANALGAKGPQAVPAISPASREFALGGSSTIPFSIFWITDTQFLSESNPALYKILTSWIVSNWRQFNGKVVIHTGDIVQTGAVQEEWQNADEAMSMLTSNGIPYSWCAGNHDDMVENQATSGWSGNLWTSSFDPSEAASRMEGIVGASWVSDFHDGMNTALTFSASDLDFLVVNLEWNAQSDVLQWLKGLLDDPEYEGYRIIVAPHAYINAWGGVVYTSSKIDLTSFVTGLTTLLNEHSSRVFLTLNGHYATECGYNTPGPINGRNELMFDRQDCLDKPGDTNGRGVDTALSTTPDSDKVGGATVTVLTLNTEMNELSASTYDVYTDAWRNDPYERYTIPLFRARP